MRNTMPLLLLLIAGCGGDYRPAATSDHVDITGSVTAAGKSVNGINLNLQPTGPGLPAVIPVTDGKFSAKVVPGKYTYFVTKGSSSESLSAIPEKYAEGSLDRQIDIGSGSNLEIKLD